MSPDLRTTRAPTLCAAIYSVSHTAINIVVVVVGEEEEEEEEEKKKQSEWNGALRAALLRAPDGRCCTSRPLRPRLPPWP